MSTFATPGPADLQPSIVVTHLGARLHYAVATLLEREDLLLRLVTDSYTGRGSPLRLLLKLIPGWARGAGLRRLAQREAPISGSRVRAYNLLGLRFSRAMAATVGQEEPTALTDTHLNFGREFTRHIIRDRLLDGASGLYTFNRSTPGLVSQARKRGLVALLEQMGAPVGTLGPLLAEELLRWKGWQRHGAAAWDYAAWQPEEEEEWAAASVVIAPSAYIQEQLVAAGVDAGKIRTIPYAVSLDRFRGRIREYRGDRPLRVLFVGSVNLRKGVPYLLEAARRLGRSRLQIRLVGGVSLNRDQLGPYLDNIELLGLVPRQEVARHYEWADLFVLPSLCEGSATVTYEARACGLPVVATVQTGAWIRDGEDGLIVPMRDSDALVETFERLLDEPELIGTLSARALEGAVRFSWTHYQQNLVQVVRECHS